MNQDYLYRFLREHIGEVREVAPLLKGFSNEKKFKVAAASGDYLLRVASEDAAQRKQQEFALMREVHGLGVSCNRPVAVFAPQGGGAVYSLFSFLPGEDAEERIQALPEDVQYSIGYRAGRDLKTIHSIESGSRTWKERKIRKHERYVRRYQALGYTFPHDAQVLQFIQSHMGRIPDAPDVLLHDDFHLGNIVIRENNYGGILDFNRFDWGDPLHEYVKLEWFTRPVSSHFARGQLHGYFGSRPLHVEQSATIALYVAMSVISTVVWTLEYHPRTMPHIEEIMRAILEKYAYFSSPEIFLSNYS